MQDGDEAEKNLNVKDPKERGRLWGTERGSQNLAARIAVKCACLQNVKSLFSAWRSRQSCSRQQHLSIILLR